VDQRLFVACRALLARASVWLESDPPAKELQSKQYDEDDNDVSHRLAPFEISLNFNPRHS
jgi:hypothetical protein